MTKSHIEVCGTPSIMHLSSGATGSTAVHPIARSSHPQNFLHISLVFVIERLHYPYRKHQCGIGFVSCLPYVHCCSGESDVHVFQLSLAAQVLPDEVLPVYGVVTHVELHDFGDGFLVAELYLVKPHVLSDEVHELC